MENDEDEDEDFGADTELFAVPEQFLIDSENPPDSELIATGNNMIKSGKVALALFAADLTSTIDDKE